MLFSIHKRMVFIRGIFFSSRQIFLPKKTMRFDWLRWNRTDLDGIRLIQIESYWFDSVIWIDASQKCYFFTHQFSSVQNTWTLKKNWKILKNEIYSWKLKKKEFTAENWIPSLTTSDKVIVNKCYYIRKIHSHSAQKNASHLSLELSYKMKRAPFPKEIQYWVNTIDIILMRSANLEMLQLSPIPYQINYLNKVFLTLNSYQLEAIDVYTVEK